MNLRILFFFAAIVLLQSCNQNENGPPQNQGPLVTIQAIQKRDVPVSFSSIAQTQSSRLVNIQARVSGFLDKKVYTEGSIVKEGEVLFLMDKKPFQTQVDSAQAALEREKAALLNAKQNLDRVEPLAKLNALSQKDLDDARGAFETASASVEQAKAELQKNLLNLSYCTITSPLTGITSSALQQEGSYINLMDSNLTTVSAISPIWVNFSLSENQLETFREEIRKGRLIPPKDDKYVVTITLVNGSVFPYKGEITFAEPFFNPQTGTFLIRASVENPEGTLRPNQFVHTTVEGSTRPNSILIPQAAVQESSKGYFVWVLDNEDKATLRPVDLGDWHGTDWFVNEGLSEGDRVVIEGTIQLQPGIKVRLANGKEQ